MLHFPFIFSNIFIVFSEKYKRAFVHELQWIIPSRFYANGSTEPVANAHANQIQQRKHNQAVKPIQAWVVDANQPEPEF